jgi:hypothetical protein
MRERNPEGALAIYDAGLTRLDEIPATSPTKTRYTIHLLAQSSYVLRRLGRMDEAQRRLDRSFLLLDTLHMYPSDTIEPHHPAEIALRARAAFEVSAGNALRGAKIYQEILEKMSRSEAKPLEDLAAAYRFSLNYQGLREACRLHGDTQCAANAGLADTKLWNHWSKRLPDNSFVHRQRNAIKK